MSSESGSTVYSERVMNVLGTRIKLYSSEQHYDKVLYVIILGGKITHYITYHLVDDK